MALNDIQKQYREDNHFGWQVDKPVFVKQAFTAFGKQWQRGEEFNWLNQNFRGEDWFKQLQSVHSLYNTGYLHHDSAREKQSKVGDRLSEMNGEELYRLTKLLNDQVKDRTSSATEFADKKVKTSKIESKQRGLIRQWLRRNAWASEDFYKFRDAILGE